MKSGGFDLRLIFLPMGYCNYRCSFCHQEGLPEVRDGSPRWNFEPQRIKDLVEWLKPAGLEGVTMSGGEPLLALDNLLEVAAALPRLPVTLVTNGTHLWSLIKNLDRLDGRPLRINLNVPAFEESLFRRLTNQNSWFLSRALEAARMLVGLGVEVNLNCVVCPGENDEPKIIDDYLSLANEMGISSARFLVQSEVPSKGLIGTLEALLGPSVTWRARHAGRVLTLVRNGSCSVEVVSCQRQVNARQISWEDGADLYLTARKSVKFGLWGEEIFFDDWHELRSLVTRQIGADPHGEQKRKCYLVAL